MSTLYHPLSTCRILLGIMLLFVLFYLPNRVHAGDKSPLLPPVTVERAVQQPATSTSEDGGASTSEGSLFSAPMPVISQEQALLQQRLEYLYFEKADRLGQEPVYVAGYLLDLYRHNLFKPLWVKQDTINQLLGSIVSSAEEGLIPDDYHLKALKRYSADLHKNPSLAQQVDYDLLLSDALILLGEHKRYGKVDSSKIAEKQELQAATAPPSLVNTSLIAIRTGTVSAYLDRLSPRHQSYVNLKEALRQYKGLADKGGWQQVAAGQSIKPGMSDPRVPAIRHRLAATGEYPLQDSDVSNVYDEHLVAAIKAFQHRHHLEPDGVTGKATIRAMNATVAKRISQIRVNLERARWMSADMPGSHIRVDIAGFRLQYYHDKALVWSSKVVVGSKFFQTPTFRSVITYMVLNPTWTPTPNIIKNETVPSIIRDPEFLTRQRFRVFDSSGTEVDPTTILWEQYQGKFLPYTLRQEASINNSLGLIKFLLPNPYYIYLHDTPSKFLFARAQRAFSHGCIRVENPLELGRVIVTNDTGNKTTVAKMNQLLTSGKTATVSLKQPLPIYLVYQTAHVQDEKLMFRPDIYSRDQALLTALDLPPSTFDLSPHILGAPEVKKQAVKQLAKSKPSVEDTAIDDTAVENTAVENTQTEQGNQKKDNTIP